MLWMRFVLLYAVAQAHVDEVLAGSQGQVSSVLSEPSEAVKPPREIKGPVELAQWVLRQAAKNRHGVSGPPASSFGKVQASKRVLFAWEHPADPATYRPASQAPRGGWAWWWAFPEWHAFSKAYSIWQARFDQGVFGHVRPKPSVLATTSWFLFEELHQRVLDSSKRARFEGLPVALRDRIRASQTCWAPGLSALVRQAWARWGSEQGLWSEVEARQVFLARLSEQELQALHEINDHVPYRKGCPVCISAQGRQRRGHTGQFAASFFFKG